MTRIATMGSRVAASSRWDPDRPRLDGNAYDILGVKSSADASEIKKAYHRTARMWHPDVSTQHDAKDVFAHVSRAHEILRNADQRMLYDFVLEHEPRNVIGLASRPDRFESLFANNNRAIFLLRHRHTVGWGIAAAIAGIAAGSRYSIWCSSRGNPPPAARSGIADADGASPSPPTHHNAAASASSTSLSPPPRASISAVGGLMGSIGGVLAVGASSTSSARRCLTAALCGALVGRSALPQVDATVHGMRLMSTPAASQLVDSARPLCEAVGALAGMLLMRQQHPEMGWMTLHARSLRSVLIGALVGHCVSRVAVRREEASPPWAE